jgi:hypothetical protein
VMPLDVWAVADDASRHVVQRWLLPVHQ